MLLLSDKDCPVGAGIELAFAGEDNQVAVNVQGTVKRSDLNPATHRYEIAVEFTETDWAQRASILAVAPSLGPGVEGWQNRSYVRVGCALDVQFKAGLLGRWRTAAAEDLGVGGLRLRTETPPRAGSRVSVRLPLGSGEPTALTGVVVDVAASGEADSPAVSISFIAPTDEARDALADYVMESLSEGARAPA